MCTCILNLKIKRNLCDKVRIRDNKYLIMLGFVEVDSASYKHQT